VRRAPAALAMLVLVLGACSGDDDAERSEPTAAPPPTIATTTIATTIATTTGPPPATTPNTVVAGPADVAAPSSAAAAAEVLTRVETELRSDTRDEAQLAQTGWEQDLAYAALRAHPEWLPDVLAQVPDSVRPVVAANADARAQISELNLPQPNLPAWNIRPPLPRDELLGYYREAEAASGVPWPYLAGIHLIETRLGRIVGTSTAGAQGPMQFMPPSWEAFGEGGDVSNDRDAILAAGRYLEAAGAPDDMPGALFSYNHSDRYVVAVTAYAQTIMADPRAYDGYYNWQVHYATTDGTYLLPEGYTSGSGAVPLAL
jgi:membrane-bound lytic murein transglycosylase B